MGFNFSKLYVSTDMLLGDSGYASENDDDLELLLSCDREDLPEEICTRLNKITFKVNFLMLYISEK